MLTVTRPPPPSPRLTLTEPGSELEQRYGDFLAVLLTPPFSAILATCESLDVSDADAFAEAAVALALHRRVHVDVVCAVLSKEIDATLYAQTLLRSNSIASRLTRSLSRHCGAVFLKTILRPIAEEILSGGALERFEVKTDAPEGAVEQLSALAQRIIDAVDVNINLLHVDFRAVVAHTHRAAAARHPGAEMIAASSSLFLRLVCPALVAPEAAGIVDRPLTEIERRPFILAAKVIQNLASGMTTFKELYMKPLAPFLTSNAARIGEIVSHLLDSLIDAPPAEPPALDVAVVIDAAAAIHRLAWARRAKIEQILALCDGGSGAFANAMDALGEPKAASVSKPDSSTFGSSGASATDEEQRLLTFLDEHKDVDVSVVAEKKVVYRQGTSKDGHPVVYVILRRVRDIVAHGADCLLVAVIRMLAPLIRAPFDVVVDCLWWDRRVDSLEWGLLTDLYRIFPNYAKQNLSRLFIVFPNLSMKEFSNNLQVRLMLTTSRAKAKDFCVLVDSLAQLYEHFEEAQLALPQETKEVEDDSHTAFSQVLSGGGGVQL
jgi:hypothetical protein